MNPAIPFEEIEALFHRAMDAPESERAQFVEDSTNGNTGLRAEVLSLVEAVKSADRLSTDGGAEREARTLPGLKASIGMRLGAFKMTRLLGRGGMGEVYAGSRAEGDLEQAVAIKVIDALLDSQDLRDTFFRERDALARLQHPHIAQLLDGGVTEDCSPYLVMELVGEEGRPAERLDDYCESRRLAVRERVALVTSVCDAVAFAHHKLIVHGDLKPGNVLVTADGNLKLLDFGASRLLGADEEGSRPRAFTPAYASPEQMRAEPIAAASDIYSMGKLLERMVGTAQDAELGAVIGKATQAEPKMRYASMERLADDLRAWLEHRPVGVYAGGRSYAARKWLRRNRRAAAAIGVVALVLAACIAVTQRSAHRAITERDRAAESAAAVEKLAHRLLVDFQPQLSELGSSTEAQHQLATTTLSYLNELSLDPALSSAGLRQDTADAYARMGNLLGNPYEENLGQPKEAIAALRKAVETATALVREGPDNKEARFTLAMAQRSLGEVEFGASDPKAAQQAMMESVKNFQLLTQAPDATLAVLAEASTTLGGLGDLYGGIEGLATLDRKKDAVECYRQANLLNERELQIDAKNVRARRSEAVSDYKMANIAMDTDPNAAIAGYEKALSELDPLPEDVRSGARVVRLVIIIEGHQSNAYFKQGKIAKAIAKKRHVRDQSAMLVARDPLDNRASYDLATVNNSLGEMLTTAGDRQGARQAYREALQSITFMLKRDPDNAVLKEHRRDLEEALEKLNRMPAAYRQKATQQ